MRRLPLLACLLLAGCAMVSDVQPGRGHAVTIEGRAYGDVWNAAMRVAGEQFAIQESDQAKGVIRAKRTIVAFSWGEWVGIFITPPAEGATSYRVEVVNRGKLWITGQDWEHKVARDIEDVLARRRRR